MYIILLLFFGTVTGEGNVTARNQIEERLSMNPIVDVIKRIHHSLPVVQRLFNNILGRITEASFRSFLDVVSQLVGSLFPPPPVPAIKERWWGDKPANNSIRPFMVKFSDEMISDLRGRIQSRRNTTHSLRGAAHKYGTNSDFLRWFLESWANQYDFQQRERWLNKFPHYLTTVQGLDIHFIHVKPPNPHAKKVLPLLLLHGWPATAFEYIHVIEFLQQEREECEFVFEAIVPDLPSFGYSEGTNKIGLAPYEMAVIMKNLMTRVGHPRFYVHSCGISQAVGDALAVFYPDRVMGLHTTLAFSIRPQTLTKYVLGQLYPAAVVQPRHQSRMYPISDKIQYFLENFGYFHVQATRPDNVGYGLDESPVALASWILQIILSGAAPENILVSNGNAGRFYDMLDWFDCFTVFWATQTMATSARMYAEFTAWKQNPLSLDILLTPVKVPFAVVRFSNDLIYQPDDFLRDRYPALLQATTLDFGGQFASYQEPAVLVDHIWTSVTKMEAFNDKHHAVNQAK